MVKSRKINMGMRVVLFCSILFLPITMLLNITGINCLASNYEDSLYEYEIDTDEDEITDLSTPFRGKQDDSCAYMHNQTSNGTIHDIRVLGSHDCDTYEDCTDLENGHEHESCEVGESVFLYNWVSERGYENAAEEFDPGDGHHNFISILWSPDSIR